MTQLVKKFKFKKTINSYVISSLEYNPVSVVNLPEF